jgi:hypothetical protein
MLAVENVDGEPKDIKGNTSFYKMNLIKFKSNPKSTEKGFLYKN